MKGNRQHSSQLQEPTLVISSRKRDRNLSKAALAHILEESVTQVIHHMEDPIKDQTCNQQELQEKAHTTAPTSPFNILKDYKPIREISLHEKEEENLSTIRDIWTALQVLKESDGAILVFNIQANLSTLALCSQFVQEALEKDKAILQVKTFKICSQKEQ